MTYRVITTPEADEDFAKLAKSEPKQVLVISNP